VWRIGSAERKAVLQSHRLWRKGKHGYTLGFHGLAVELSLITIKGKERWKWSVMKKRSVLVCGESRSLKEAQVTAIEQALRGLESSQRYKAFRRLLKLVIYDFM
jgi:hypothetical protein